MALRLLACLGPASARTCARGGARGSGPSTPGPPAQQEVGVQGRRPSSPESLRAPKHLFPKPRCWGDRAPVSPLGDSLESRPSAHGPAAPTLPPPLPGKSLQSPFGQFLGRQDGRVVLASDTPDASPAPPRPPGLLANGHKVGDPASPPLFPGFPPPSSFTPLLGLLSSRPVQALRPARGSAVGSSSPKPRRAKWRFCPLPPHRAPPRDDQGPPAPGEDAKS